MLGEEAVGREGGEATDASEEEEEEVDASKEEADT